MLTEMGTVKYRQNGTEHVGTYEVAGFILTLTCAAGTFKAATGLADHQKLARNLLKAVCTRVPDSRRMRRPQIVAHPAGRTSDLVGARA